MYEIASVRTNTIKVRNDFSSSDNFLTLDNVARTLKEIMIGMNDPTQQNGMRAKPEVSIQVNFSFLDSY